MKDKKVILTYYDVENNISEEMLWIEQKNEQEYQIKNIPFFAPNIAYDDIITVENDNGNLYFDEVVKTSEHSTIQIIFFKGEFIGNTIKEIEALGCSWEGMDNQKLIGIDVPPNINYSIIQFFLTEQFKKEILDYKEACLSKTHSEQRK